jgi:16S rRNA (guanine1516-N2)-methyltransferase
LSADDGALALPPGWRAERVDGALTLRAPDGGRLCADFGGGAVGWRLARARGREQAIARAAGCGRGRAAPRVFDATAGLGRDAAVLATLGCEVIAVERHPAVHALLADALARADAAAEPRARLGGRLRLLCGDARALLRGGAAAGCDVVLLDPMHPERRKSALVKQEMRLFRALVGADEDAEELLEAASASGVPRIAVKRPAGAPPLGARAPQGCIEGRTTRFDLYLRTMDATPRAPR